ncbi:hypothetical protein CDAR_595391 [Caerostris darwini]|uniref:Uncharacterized protein n=1 Tax=Caerostris darwini TaxID=1538125 RepID=A0AAV4SGM6_9ARAC|nr:hypothetical protein CDAR_595391 [Caerostris darwini]
MITELSCQGSLSHRKCVQYRNALCGRNLQADAFCLANRNGKQSGAFHWSHKSLPCNRPERKKEELSEFNLPPPGLQHCLASDKVQSKRELFAWKQKTVAVKALPCNERPSSRDPFPQTPFSGPIKPPPLKSLTQTGGGGLKEGGGSSVEADDTTEITSTKEVHVRP